MNHAARFVSGFAFAVAAFACSVTSTSPGLSPGGSNSQQVDRCKAGCDKMKFFDCSSANELASCYNDCGTAAASQLEVFISCAENSICDPACRTNIKPAPATGSTGTATPTGGGGVAASDCQSACTKLITECSFAPVGQQSACVSQCQETGYQIQIDCVNHNQCQDIKTRCGSPGAGGTSPGPDAGLPDLDLTRCQFDCDTLNSRQCINAQEHSTCRSKCASTGAARDTFMSCGEGAFDCTNAHDCYAVFTK